MSSEASIFAPIRDPYYLETVVFKVENTLFKVPRFQFERHSGIFATTFSLPQSGEGAEGSSDKTPFKLDGIKSLDFRRLLGVLYPMTPIPKTPTFSKDEWISVLKLANLWDFIEVRNLAIEQLTSYAGSLDCIERILFARRFDVSAWLQSGYVELARRKAVVSAEEAEKIGWENALQICQLREAKTLSTSSGKNPYEKIDLGDTFQAELKRADAAHEPLPAAPRILANTPAYATTSEDIDALTNAGASKKPYTFTIGSSPSEEAASPSTNGGPKKSAHFKFGSSRLGFAPNGNAANPAFRFTSSLESHIVPPPPVPAPAAAASGAAAATAVPVASTSSSGSSGGAPGAASTLTM